MMGRYLYDQVNYKKEVKPLKMIHVLQSYKLEASCNCDPRFQYKTSNYVEYCTQVHNIRINTYKNGTVRILTG